MVQAVHTSVKGRARYKVEGLYRSESLKQLIEQHLSQQKWILSVSVNTLTGTVLVLFDSQNGNRAPSIASLLEAAIERTSGAPLPKKEGQATDSPLMEGKIVVRSESTTVSPRSPAGKEVPSLHTVRKQVSHAGDQQEEAWHCMSKGEVLQRWGTSASSGLS